MFEASHELSAAVFIKRGNASFGKSKGSSKPLALVSVCAWLVSAYREQGPVSTSVPLDL